MIKKDENNQYQIEVDSLFISDLHLGAKTSKPEIVLKLFRKYSFKKLFLIGDIFDLWRLKTSHYWCKDTTKVVQKFLKYAKNGIEIYYITGNHDGYLREYTPFSLDNIHFLDEIIIDNGETWVVHGDIVDNFVTNFPIISRFAGYFYDVLKSKRFFMNLNFRRKRKFEENFIKDLVKLSKERKTKRIICGHTHYPKKLLFENIEYYNCGDFVTNFSFVIKKENKYELVFLD